MAKYLVRYFPPPRLISHPSDLKVPRWFLTMAEFWNCIPVCVKTNHGYVFFLAYFPVEILYATPKSPWKAASQLLQLPPLEIAIPLEYRATLGSKNSSNPGRNLKKRLTPI